MKKLKKFIAPIAAATSTFLAACGPTPPRVEKTKDQIKLTLSKEDLRTREGVEAIREACSAAVSKCCDKAGGGGYCGDTMEHANCVEATKKAVEQGENQSEAHCDLGNSQKIDIQN